MRYLIGVAIFIAIVGGAAPCAAQYFPPGDFVRTCRDIHRYGNRLDAECQRQNGSWRRTSLDGVDQCVHGITNNNGRLTCARDVYGDYRRNWRNGLPYGDYVQTCRNIHVYGNRLEAECQTLNGGWRRTALDYVRQCSSPIANDNGSLVCGRDRYGYNREWQGGVPDGTYALTCRNIRVYGNTLEAECQREDGSWRRSSLDHVGQCTSPPAIDNGYLVCGRG